MTDTLTLDQIHAAQANDLNAIRVVLDAMEGRIARLASQAASSMGSNQARYADYADDFRQDAAVSLFEHLPRWTGDSADEFFAFMYASISGDLKAKTHAERNAGADRDAMSIFKAMVDKADGDVFRAERLAQTEPPKGKRLSADRAHAARIAWQGAVSIDKPAGDDEGTSILHTLVAPQEAREEIHPKVGRGAAEEALRVLERYVTTPRDAAERTALLSALDGVTSGRDIDVIEECISVPRDAQIRRYVLDAIAILRSYVSTATDGALVDDLRDASDDRKDERAVKINTVTDVLDKMAVRAPGQVLALRYTFGIGGCEAFGHGDGCDNEGFANALGLEVNAARVSRTKAFKNFAKHYIAAVARSTAEALSLAEGATANLSRGGRK